MTRIVAAEPQARHQATLPVGWSIIKGLEWLIVQAVILLPRIVIYAVKRGRQSRGAFFLYVYAAVPFCLLLYDAYLGWGPYVGGAIRSMLTMQPNLRALPLPFSFGTIFHTMEVHTPFGHEVLTLVQLARLGAMLLPVPLVDWSLRRYAQRYERMHPPPPPIFSDPEKLVVGLESARVWVPEVNQYRTEPTRNFYTLGWEHLPTGMLVLAPQGGGKTTFMKQIMQYNDRNGIAYLLLDYKGDQFDPSGFDYNFDLANPDVGPALNIASGFSPRTVGMNLGAAGVPFLSMSQEYYTGVARQTTSALFVCHHAAYDEYPEISTIIAYTRNAEARGRLLKALKDRNYSIGSEPRLEMDRIMDLATKKGQDAFGTLDVALSQLAWEAPKKLLTTRGGIGFDELLSKPSRIRVALAFNEYNLIAPVIGRLILGLFINSVLSPRNAPNLRRMVILDESAPFMSRTLLEGMRLMRYHNGSVVLGVQDTHAIEDMNLREQTLTLSGTKIIMGGIGGLDSETISALLGGIEHDYNNDSAGVSQGNSVNVSGGMMASGRKGKAGSVTETSGKTQLARVRSDYLPSELRYQAKHHAVVESRTADGEIARPVLVDMNNKVVMPSVELQGEISLMRRAATHPPPLGPEEWQASELQPSNAEQLPDPKVVTTESKTSQETMRGSTPPLYTLSDTRSVFSQLDAVTEPDHRIFMPPGQQSYGQDWGTEDDTLDQGTEQTGGESEPTEQETQHGPGSTAPADGPMPDARDSASRPTSHRPKHRQLKLALPSDAPPDGVEETPETKQAQPEWIAEVFPQLMAKLPKLGANEALSWCQWAHKYGRDGEYIQKVMDYVLNDRDLHNPVAKFITIVRTNQEPPSITHWGEEAAG